MASYESKSDIERVFADFLAGVPQADNALMRALLPDLRLKAQRFLARTNIDPDDVVQDTLISLLKHFKGDTFTRKVKIKGYAIIALRNRCRDYQRRSRVDLQSDPVRDHDEQKTLQDQLEELVRAENERGLQQALDMLDEKCRQLIMAHYYRGFSIKELQGRMRTKSTQILYYRKHNCLEKLRKIFANLPVGESLKCPEQQNTDSEAEDK